MRLPPLLLYPEDVEELVFHESVLGRGYYHNMTATLIKEGNFVGELVGIKELFEIGEQGELVEYKRNLTWNVSLPSQDVLFYLDLLLVVELRDEPYHRVRRHTGLSSTRSIEVKTSQKTITFRNRSQDRTTITPWEVTIGDKVQVSPSKTLTNTWQLLYNALWINERIKALSHAKEESQPPKCKAQR
jgi:hypothetical protein